MEAFKVIVNEDECKHLEWVCEILDFKYKLIDPNTYEITPEHYHNPSSVFNLAYMIRLRTDIYDILNQ